MVRETICSREQCQYYRVGDLCSYFLKKGGDMVTLTPHREVITKGKTTHYPTTCTVPVKKI